MKRGGRPLRGSVQQAPVRLRAQEDGRFGFLVRLGLLGGSLLLIFALLAWLWHIGWPQRQTHRATEAALHVTGKAHLAVHDIIVEGRQQTSRDSLSTALNTGAGAPILGFDPNEAAARITALPWVANVTVERRLPDTIYVKLTERVPLARWQHDNIMSVIDTEGVQLDDAQAAQFNDLPLVVGTGAPAKTHELLDVLQEYPVVAQAMVGAVRVSERRWDLHLQPKTVARLPETDMRAAVGRLSSLISDKKILDRDVTAIDLRMQDRMILESGAPAPVTTHPSTQDRHL